MRSAFILSALLVTASALLVPPVASADPDIVDGCDFNDPIDLEPVAWVGFDGDCGDCKEPYSFSAADEAVTGALFAYCEGPSPSCTFVIVRVLGMPQGGVRLNDPLCVYPS